MASSPSLLLSPTRHAESTLIALLPLSPSYFATCSAFDEYYKAYSVAVMPGPERANLAYGGKSGSHCGAGCRGS